MVVLLAVQGAMFLLWTVTTFRILFHLWRRSTERTGTPFAGPFAFLTTIGDWLRDPAERGWRWVLLGVTVAVMVLSYSIAAAG